MGGVDGERLFPWPFASKEEGGRKRPAGRHPAAHHCKLKGVRQHIALADGGGKRLPLQPWLAVFLLLPRLVGHGAISLRGDRKRIFLAQSQPPRPVGDPVDADAAAEVVSTEERRVGKEWVSTGNARWSPDH